MQLPHFLGRQEISTCSTIHSSDTRLFFFFFLPSFIQHLLLLRFNILPSILSVEIAELHHIYLTCIGCKNVNQQPPTTSYRKTEFCHCHFLLKDLFVALPLVVCSWLSAYVQVAQTTCSAHMPWAFTSLNIII